MPAPTIRVIAAVIAKHNTLLVCQRPAHKRHGGLWEFPGGKCEPGETDADAARRELAEELAVTVTVVGPALLEVQDLGSPYLIVFLPVTIIGTPQCLEHPAHHWGTPAELAIMALAPGDRHLVESLIRRDGLHNTEAE